MEGAGSSQDMFFGTGLFTVLLSGDFYFFHAHIRQAILRLTPATWRPNMFGARHAATLAN